MDLFQLFTEVVCQCYALGVGQLDLPSSLLLLLCIFNFSLLLSVLIGVCYWCVGCTVLPIPTYTVPVQVQVVRIFPPRAYGYRRIAFFIFYDCLDYCK